MLVESGGEEERSSFLGGAQHWSARARGGASSGGAPKIASNSHLFHTSPVSFVAPHVSIPLSLSTPHVPVSLQRTASKGVRRFFHRSSASRSFVTTFIKLGKTELPRATPK